MSGTNPGNATPSGAAWTAPQPAAVLGLSSSMVYGTSFASSLPQYLQLATGSQLKICVDPLGFSSAFMKMLDRPPFASTDLFLGSGITGNVQLTLGTSANVTLGEVYNIHLGPKAHDIRNGAGKTHPHCTTFWLGLAIGALAVAFQIAYGLESKDDHRANWVLAFQVTMEVLLATLMTLEGVLGAADDAFTTAIWNLHVPQKSDSIWEKAGTYLADVGATTGLAVAALAGAIASPILDSEGESTLQENLQEDAAAAAGPTPKSTGDPGTGAYVKAT